MPYKKPCPVVTPPPDPEPEPGPTPTLYVSDVSVNEAAGFVTVTITKQGTSSSSSHFTYATSNATATAGSDYTSISGSAEVGASASSKTITVPIINDTTDESDETFTFTITAGTNSQVSDGSATITIVDNDDPVPTVVVDDVMVNENSGTAVLTITRSAAANNPTVVNYSTADMTATAGQDYTAKSGTATIPSGALTTTVTVTILEDTKDESDEEFTFTITPNTNANVTSGTASVMIHDNDDPVVVTPPDTTPQPETGAAAIPSNFDVNTAISAAGIPAVNSTDVVGAFRFICGAGQVSRNDPVVYPGQANKSHIHQFYGNTLADHNSTFNSLRTTGESTCNNMPGTGHAANRSAYWMPAMLDGKGNVVLPDYIQVYYKREPEPTDPAPYQGRLSACDPARTGGAMNCIQIPNGLRYITGFNMTTAVNNNAGWFLCTNMGGVKGYANGTAMTNVNLTTCPVGTRLEMTMSGPSCWNGQLDSTDHISHMTGKIRNASTGIVSCPTTHPYYMPVFTISAFFSVKAGDDPALWSLSSDSMYPSKARGSTLHFDYFEAWDAEVKAMWEAGCINKKLNCSAGNMGNGKALKGASQPSYGWFNPTHLVPISSIP